MELTFSKMTVDTSLAQEYLKKNEALSELYSDYDANVKKNPSRHGGVFKKVLGSYNDDETQNILWRLAANLKEKSELIAQLEYHIRKIPIEDTKTQLNVLIQYVKSFVGIKKDVIDNIKSDQHFSIGDPLLNLAQVVYMMVHKQHDYIILYTTTKEPVAICHLFVTLCHQAGVLCSQALTYEGRTFLIDPVQVVEAQQSFVIVEAYRTAKEVISILQQDEPHYLSLWINGIAQINEFTQNTNAAVVWVNNIGDIRGPPLVARALHPVLQDKYHSTTIFNEKNDRIAKLVKLSQPWSKMDLDSRRDILMNVLQKYMLSDPQNLDYTHVRKSLLNLTSESFVQTGKDYTCTGLWKPAGFIALPATEWSLSLAVTLALQGNALVFYSLETPSKVPNVELLEAAGVPVVHVESCPSKPITPGLRGPTRTLQVIWTNSGTIFAN
ncbi:hypothetical protein HF086_014729 [Spodoptera exigua]|uniref:Uncharacterized protein n=1 Tax=Spodoptera exigua TaxID=7107 RepID=A0A922SC18_SPOEX|nr:hypothetical protein HF086_014729 [Spodoptera exigua]